MSALSRAQERLRKRINDEKGEEQRKAFQADFARMIRQSNWQLNVEHKWPTTVTATRVRQGRWPQNAA
jgi:hypothetical protein